MSDLLSPLLSVMQDEVLAFACFKSLMKSMGAAFDASISGLV